MSTPVVNLLQRAARRFTPVRVDASRHDSELYYAELYLEAIRKYLAGLGDGLKMLDAGCGTARLLLPLARDGHALTGIDFHRDSLKIAQQNLSTAGLHANLIEADLRKALKRIPDAHFDAAMAIESIYVSEEFDAIVDELARVVRPGGLLFITHRTRFYYLAKALAEGHFDDAEHVATHSSGRLRKGMHRVFHHWQSRRQIDETYASCSLALLSLHAIGVCSGFGVDPLACVCDPGGLDGAQRAVLRKIESCDEDLLMTGRYVLAVARKPG